MAVYKARRLAYCTVPAVISCAQFGSRGSGDQRALQIFGDSIAELRAWLDARPMPTATIAREERGSCTVLRPVADRTMPWPEKVRAGLRERRARPGNRCKG